MGACRFWSHTHSSFGSITPIHTKLIPPSRRTLSGKAAPDRESLALQEIINKNLNGSTAVALTSLLNVNEANEEKPKEPQIAVGGFDAFTDTNPFTLKSLDAYVYPRSP